MIKLTSGLVYACFLIGLFMPDLWWGTHYLAFLDPASRYTILGISLIPMLALLSNAKEGSLDNLDLNNTYWQIVIPLAMGLIMFFFPMANDIYGDAINYVERMDRHPEVIPPGTYDALFSFSLSPWAGQKTVLAIVTYISYWGSMSYRIAFQLLGALCGLLFTLIWFRFILQQVRSKTWQLILLLAGLSSPFFLNFYGHAEMYAPVLVLVLLWITQAIGYWQRDTKHGWLWLTLLLLLCLKFYSMTLLFVPALALFMVKRFAGENLNGTLLHWKGISKFLLAPIFLAGAIVYFFVLGDHVDERHFRDTAMEFDRLFLPLFSPDPPLDTYNLLSINHLFDFFNIFLTWSPIGIFILIYRLIKDKKIELNSGPMMLVATSLLLFTAMFFMVNPLLGAQMDWDMLTVPAPLFLVWLALIVKDKKDDMLDWQAILGALGIAVISSSAFFMSASPEAVSLRVESLGIRNYHSYYEWTSRTIDHAIGMEKDVHKQAERRQRVIEKIRPFARPGVDLEFQRILDEQASYHLRVAGNPVKALEFLEEAKYYFDNDADLYILFMEAHFQMGQYREAYGYSKHLLTWKHPDEEKALRAVIHCAIAMKDYREARTHTERYLNTWQEPVFQELYDRLVNEERLDQLLELFEN